jgi:ArsR family transcriptional regulator, cadmium/lead-responsive transcriptional repressor
MDAAVALFHSLSDRTRLTIVRRLARGEARVADLIGELGLAQSTVSAHVACLREFGLVEGRPQGRQMFYSLARPGLLDLLASAEQLLAATGSAVALCPRTEQVLEEIDDVARAMLASPLGAFLESTHVSKHEFFSRDLLNV